MTKLAPLSIISNRATRQETPMVAWVRDERQPHGFHAAIIPEEEGGFSAIAIHYPGVVSQGETIEEARANVAEAFLALLEARQVHGEALYYSIQPIVDLPRNCKRTWIDVDG